MTSDKKTSITVSSIILSGELTHVKSHARQANKEVIAPNQLTSISAMIAYVASKTGKSEFRIERSLADSFKVANAKFLAPNDFDAAIRYLADIIQS